MAQAAGPAVRDILELTGFKGVADKGVEKTRLWRNSLVHINISKAIPEVADRSVVPRDRTSSNGS